MMRKIILWSVFFTLSGICIWWLTHLIVDASKAETMRYGAAKKRAELAGKEKGPVLIGVVVNNGKIYSSMLNGINMAAEEVNRAGGVLGRTIEIVQKDEDLSIANGMKAAQELADNLAVTAVIGHSTSNVSIATSLIYEYYGLLMMSPNAGSPNFIKPGHKLVFRNIISDKAIGIQMAEVAFHRGYKNIVIYYAQDDYGRGLANFFEKRCDELGISIADRLPYDVDYKEADFSRDLLFWKKQLKFDAIFLAGYLPQAAQVILQARRDGITLPILAGNGIDNNELVNLAGKAAEGIIVASTFDPEYPTGETRAFKKAYLIKYGHVPDMYAAQGYDALKLLAYSMKKAGSTVPERVAGILHSTVGWKGAIGPYTFDINGDVTDRPVLTKIVRNGKFELINSASKASAVNAR